MKTLSTLLNQERNSLQTELDKATSVEQVVQLVQNRLDNLERSYISELNVAQVRLASFFLEALRQSLATLTAATHDTKTLEAANQGEISASLSKISPHRLILKVLQGLLYIGLMGELFSLTQKAPGAWMAILLTCLLVGLEVVLQLDKGKGENPSDSPALVAAPAPVVRVDSQVLLDNLADVLNTIDQAVARVGEANKPLDAFGIEALPELLNLIQRLMGASFLSRPQMALELTKLLPQVLMEQGIRVQMYRPDEEASGSEYFDFEPSIDPSAKDYITITPALFKGDRLLRRGRVIEPAYSEAND